MNYGDTLKENQNWVNKNMDILSASGTRIVGHGIIYKHGQWYDISNKYMGFQINRDNIPTYGWIKVSVPDDNWIHSMTIHEIGYYDP